jgi:hypothetical protein
MNVSRYVWYVGSLILKEKPATILVLNGQSTN